ncbi:MAG: hypothetical protein ACM3TR_18060 [Caulobacteraceae bacterium]
MTAARTAYKSATWKKDWWGWKYEIKDSIRQIAEKIGIIERKPAKRWDDMVKIIVAVLVTAAVTYFFQKIRRKQHVRFLKIQSV